MEALAGLISKLFLLYCASLCTNVAATAPTNTRLSTNKSSNVFVVGEAVSLLCQSNASPAQCSIQFYQGSQLLANVTDSSCSGSHVIEKIQGCNNATFSCEANNSDGRGPRADLRVTVQAAPRFKIESVVDNTLKTVTTGVITVPEGGGLVLNCSATGCPSPNITSWGKDGTPGTLVAGVEQMLKYNASSLKRGDAGNYTCTADNGIADSPFRSTVFVDVTYKPENTIVSVNKATFTIGEKIKVSCRSVANPPRCELFFYQGSTYKTSIGSGGCSSDYQYTILAGCGSTGISCQARNTAGAGPRTSVTVTINEPPIIASISAGQSAIKGDTVIMEQGSSLQLTCNANGCPTPSMKWTKSGKTTDLTNGKTRTLVHKFDGGLENEDTGKYTCTAENGIGKPELKTIYLNVTYKPVVNVTSSVKLSANQLLKLECEVDSNPPSTIEWIRNGSVIARGRTLSLSAEESVPGSYICNASNTLGSTTKTSVIEVSVCDEKTCQNKAPCKSKGTTFQCLCKPGYRGQFCQSTDPLRDVFRINFVITSVTWTEDYTNPGSQTYKDLSNKICDAMKNLFKRPQSNILECKVLSFREGSVVAETELKLNQAMYNEEVTKNLREATKDNKLGELTLKPSSLQVSAWDACQDKPCENDGKCVLTEGGNGYKCECKLFRNGEKCAHGISLAAGIILVILACLAVIFLIIVIVYLHQKNRKRTYNTADRRPIGTEMRRLKIHNENDQDHPVAAVNKIEITDEVQTRRNPKIVANGKDGGQIVNGKDGKTEGSYEITPYATSNDIIKASGPEPDNQKDILDDEVELANYEQVDNYDVDTKDSTTVPTVDNNTVSINNDNAYNDNTDNYDVNIKDNKTAPSEEEKSVSDNNDNASNADILKPVGSAEVEAVGTEEEQFVVIIENKESVADEDKPDEPLKNDVTESNENPGSEDMKDDVPLTEDKANNGNEDTVGEKVDQENDDTKEEENAEKDTDNLIQ